MNSSEDIARKFRIAGVSTIESIKCKDRSVININSNYFIAYPWIN